ncbi:hypothetical protein T4C_7775 [Trichinella pseudospiralis]|uniref:Uncharacterized protein n=1 Tax=Trichinella pseudospiralis TaxID=6337 RepID=A0A0V1GA45_TRIPS|nr:hypothetical protein T4C_7775 [Trichinella pseudospiralis]
MIIGVVFYFQLSSDIIRLIAFNTNEEVFGIFQENLKIIGNYKV